MERQVAQRLTWIRKAEYGDSPTPTKHRFLVGDLRQPTTSPFIPDRRVELLLCNYEPGDDGRFHWHKHVIEYEWVAAGRVGYLDAADGTTKWFEAGDFVVVPAQTCVRRLVPVATTTFAVKVPSLSDKVHCSGCRRECPSRVEPCKEGE
jgi:mannose-6-phosphate isomerase-like protein (cupin superfamily)